MASSDPFTRRRSSSDARSQFSATDPAITAAFLAFHREHTHSAPAALIPRNVLGLGGWIFVGLAVVGFAGGLFLASVSFNNGETTSIAGARPPEMIYLPPPEVAERVVAVTSDAAPNAERLMAQVDAPVAEEKMEGDNAGTESRVGSVNAWSVASASDARFLDPTANFSAAMRHTAAGYSLSNTSSDGIESGYAGVELPMVPEPTATPIICLGLALLVAVKHLTKRRS